MTEPISTARIAELRELLDELERVRGMLRDMMLDDPFVVDLDGDQHFDCAFCGTAFMHMDNCPHEQARAYLADDRKHQT